MKKVITMIVCGMILLGFGFAGGTYYQKKKVSSTMAGIRGGIPPTDMGIAPGGGRQGGSPGNGVSGEIISKTDNSITVKTTDGSTKIVYFTNSTKISRNATGSVSDLAVGATVMASGTTNTDKSIASTTIMIQGSDQ